MVLQKTTPEGGIELKTQLYVVPQHSCRNNKVLYDLLWVTITLHVKF